MRTTTLMVPSLLLAASTTAQPLQLKRAADPRSVEILTKIAPKSVTCDSSGSFPDECVTATNAAQPLINSFAKYQINVPGEQVALLSWMAYESGDFKYVRNHFPAPGRPGQGCRNMMMPGFVSEYAGTLQLSNSDPAGLLNDVIRVGGEWGAASWFYTAKCSDEVKEGVKTGGKPGWTKFITGCVNTTLDEGENAREAYWTRAAQAFGMSTN